MSLKMITLIIAAILALGTAVLMATGVFPMGKVPSAVTDPSVTEAANKDLKRIRELAEKADQRNETQAERTKRFNDAAIESSKKPLQTFGR